MIRALLDRTHRALARSWIAVRVAVALRNQAQVVIGYHMSRGDGAAESWLLTTVGPDVRSFVDVGANKGDWTHEVLRHCRRNALGVLFEPSASAADLLRQRFGDDPRIRVIRAAAGDRTGEIVLHDPGSASELASVVPGWSGVETHGVRVAVVKLDDALAEIGHVDVLKIDTEGFDLHVLRGAQRLLMERRVDVLQFEYNRPWARAGSTLAAAIDFLDGCGYDTRLLTAAGPVPFDQDRFGEFFSFSNFVAVPRDRVQAGKLPWWDRA